MNWTYGDDVLTELAGYNIIFSDSATCTAGLGQYHGWDYQAGKYAWQTYTEQSRDGAEFRKELSDRGFTGEYWPLWGKGLADIHYKVLSEAPSGDPVNLGKIAVIIAGNGLPWGVRVLQGPARSCPQIC